MEATELVNFSGNVRDYSKKGSHFIIWQVPKNVVTLISQGFFFQSVYDESVQLDLIGSRFCETLVQIERYFSSPFTSTLLHLIQPCLVICRE